MRAATSFLGAGASSRSPPRGPSARRSASATPPPVASRHPSSNPDKIAGRPARVLLTNDDGVDSSLLVPFIKALHAVGGAAGQPGFDLRVLVPDAERSWSSKVMSRFTSVEMRATTRDGHAVSTLSGTPADCAALGCHHMWERDQAASTQPDLVVSGINLGANFGTAFFLSSGTVGAALEGAIAGVPAVAVSLILGDDARAAMAAGREPADTAGAVAASARVVLAAVKALRRGAWPAGVDVINVNLPAGVLADTPTSVTRVGRSRYLECFKREDEEAEPNGGAAAGSGGGGGDGSVGEFVARFQHKPSGMSWEDVMEGTDVFAVKSGRISVTPVTLEGVCSGAGAGAADLSWLECDVGAGEPVAPGTLPR